MLDYIAESPAPSSSVYSPMKFDFGMLDDNWTTSKKHNGKKKKHDKHKKSARKKQDYAKLAFQYGVLYSRYDILTRMVELSISAKRGHLNDDLLDDGLAALGRPRVVSFPER